jgi:BirA family biotin operon repressor/biotin-[acetyl-CoA-carboxylase] ligase
MMRLDPKLIDLVALLNDGNAHDNTCLAHQLQLAPEVVLRLIKKLQKYDIPVISVNENEHLLKSKFLLLDERQLRSKLHHPSVQCEVLEKVTSTNDFLKSYANNKNTMACFSETQTSGRGRLNRRWHSPFGKNIYLSLRYFFEKNISALSGLSLVIALALCKAIESLYPKISPSVKWPNDILVNGSKLAGILIEVVGQSHDSCQLIIGVGMNVNMHEASTKDIDQSWTSLSQLIGEYIDRNDLGAKMIDTLMHYLERFSEDGMQAFRQEWKTRDCLENFFISVKSARTVTHGYCLGINDLGYLVIQSDHDEVIALSSGDASITHSPYASK